MSQDPPLPPQNDDGACAPLWMATFADLMSLLLAFFVLLFSFAKVEDEALAARGAAMKEALGIQYDKPAHKRVEGTSMMATELSSAPGAMQILNKLLQDHTNEKLRIQSLTDTNKDGETEGDEGKQKRAPLFTKEEMQEVFSAELLEGSAEFKTEQGKLVIEITEDKIFYPGSNQLRENIYPLLSKIKKAFHSAKGKALVTGSSSKNPVQSQLYRSNWDLSAARAVTVGHELIKNMIIKPELLTLASSTPETSDSISSQPAQIRITLSDLERIKEVKEEFKKTHGKPTQILAEDSVQIENIERNTEEEPFIFKPIDIERVIKFGTSEQ